MVATNGIAISSTPMQFLRFLIKAKTSGGNTKWISSTSCGPSDWTAASNKPQPFTGSSPAASVYTSQLGRVSVACPGHTRAGAHWSTSCATRNADRLRASRRPEPPIRCHSNNGSKAIRPALAYNWLLRKFNRLARRLALAGERWFWRKAAAHAAVARATF